MIKINILVAVIGNITAFYFYKIKHLFEKCTIKWLFEILDCGIIYL